MLLDIEPLEDDGIQSCINFNIEAVMKWLKKDYELMYLDNWYFPFFQSSDHCDGLMKKCKIAGRIYYENLLTPYYYLEKYAGIKILEKETEKKEIIESLERQFPVVVAFDTYYIPWLENFTNIIHSEHAILVVGHQNDSFYCNDTRPYFKKAIKGGEIKGEQFEKGFLKKGLFFYDLGSRKKDDQYILELKNLLLKREDLFSNFRNFVIYLRKNKIEEIELINYQGGQCMLIRSIRNLIRARINFNKVLTFINKNDRCIENIICAFETVIEEWKDVLLLLYKLQTQKIVNENREYLCDRLSKICIKEELIYKEFCKIL